MSMTERRPAERGPVDAHLPHHPLTGRVVELERRYRLTTSTYVFASYRMVLDLDGRLVERRRRSFFLSARTCGSPAS